MKLLFLPERLKKWRSNLWSQVPGQFPNFSLGCRKEWNWHEVSGSVLSTFDSLYMVPHSHIQRVQ